ADSSKDAPKYKPDALYELLLLRVSANAAVRDLQRGAAAVQGLRAYPQYPRAQEVAAIGALLDEVNRRAEEKQQGDKRLAEVTANLTTATAKAEALETQLAAARQSDETGKLKQEAVGLRADNKTLRDETKSLREQLTRAQAEI